VSVVPPPVVVVVVVDPAPTTSFLDSVLVAVAVVARDYRDWEARVLASVLVRERERRMVKGHVEDSMLMIGLIGGEVVMAEDVAGELADMRVADVLREDLVAAGVDRGGVARVRHVEAADVTKIHSHLSLQSQNCFLFPRIHFKVNRVCIAASRCHEKGADAACDSCVKWELTQEKDKKRYAIHRKKRKRDVLVNQARNWGENLVMYISAEEAIT
jgi:hypothetical protein